MSKEQEVTISQAIDIAISCHKTGKLHKAIEIYRKVLRLKPDIAEIHGNLGSALKQQGKLEEAALCYRRALALKPDFAEVHFNLGNVLFAQHKVTEAVDCYRHALLLKPDFAPLHNNLGNALEAQHDFEEAEICYRHAMKLEPDFADIHYNLANTLKVQNKFDEAAVYYRHALNLQPNFFDAHLHLGDILKTQYQFAEATLCYRRATKLRPEFAPAYSQLGSLLQEQNLLEEAVLYYRHALTFKRDFAHVYHQLAEAFYLQGKFQEALLNLLYALTLSSPSQQAVYRVQLALLLPIIMASGQDLLESQRIVKENLTKLLHSDLEITDPWQEGLVNHLSLVSPSSNDQALQQQLGDLYSRLCPSLLYVAPHCDPYLPVTTVNSTAKLKVGILVVVPDTHRISQTIQLLITHLSRSAFSLHLFCIGTPQPPVILEKLQTSPDSIDILPLHLELAQTRLSESELDILIYPDLRQHPLLYFLAFARLATVQCVMGWDSMIPNLPTLDFFLIHQEQRTATENTDYPYKLVEFGQLLSGYHPPTLPPLVKTRRHFGLSEQQPHVYLCPQSLFKFHPDFDAILGHILESDREGQVILIEGRQSYWTELLKTRFSRILPHVLSRIHFLPRQTFPNYLNLLALADVILDPFYTGGCMTTSDALAVGTPVVTLPSHSRSGRFAYACYKIMEVTDCIADNPQHYIEVALRLGTDANYRKQIHSRIWAANHLLVGKEERNVQELEEFFLMVMNREIQS